ncbi:hypothetical protein CONCODRAFT_17234 [Conidiobolus coronatus NRRL 28638]|uniref:F-box domain-containing protein n=1 Tax=Conidiobolus coronatus (strain ATCC 28846 / CBS 209.66 / NRRL 28638) TaxID=796925 RepID=A0A137P7H8_CONC2|nr:hypothetical protein CONCODRAFT_17234 [Conidiobolus coronatus NRRL 28638]|eukprot:KXN70966.1 hypothetical protein CONCODRAFT_17234 [Conidiobolus coronatus NRRL 28638]
MLKHHNRYNHFSIIDNSVNSISSLKFLNWHCEHPSGIPILIEILTSNPKLASLYLSSSSLNSKIISLISSSKNLSMLTISHKSRVSSFSDLKFINLPYIKEIDIQNTQSNFNETCNKLIDSCQNLEVLRYSQLPNLEDHLFNLISKLKKLKVLYIYPLYTTTYPKILKTKFPSSNLEHIVILTNCLLKININIFINLKHLKSIKIPFYSHYIQNFDVIRAHYDQFRDWRVIYYPNSVYCWKIL